MVLRNKFKADGTLERRKARLVAQGFSQVPGVHYNETFAPVARMESIRLLSSLATRYNMKIRQLDVETAYLNGELEEEVIMQPPKFLKDILEEIADMENETSELGTKCKCMLAELEKGDKVCLLKKALYGLRQAGRSWYTKLDTILKDLGATPTKSDPCVYQHGNGQSVTFMAVYVDDILIMSRDPKMIKKFHGQLSKKFKVKDLGEAGYCLGIEFSQSSGKISMQQRGYLNDLLNRFGMLDSKPVSTPMDPSVKLTKQDRTEEDCKLPYRELVGALMYLAICTRPDITYAVSHLSQFNDCYGKIHWTAAKRVLRYLKGTKDLGIMFTKDSRPLRGFADADWANCPVDRRSYTGYAFVLNGSPISWNSRKQRTVVLSSTEAEYMAMSEANKEAIYLRQFLAELGEDDSVSTILMNDNMGALKLAENPSFHARSKHIDLRYHLIRDAVKDGTLKVEYTSMDTMAADILTKALPSPKLEKCTYMLGLRSTSEIATTLQLEGKC